MPAVLKEALDEPNGARFFKAALQVNPFGYKRHGRDSGYENEDEYNTAMVEACLENGIEVVGVTDHHRVETASSLIKAAREAGIRVFPGFEACTSDGVYFLCLFDESQALSDVQLRLGEFGIRSTDSPEQLGKLNAVALLDICHDLWGAACIAAHVCSDSGVLTQLSGQPRIDAWTHQHLLACGLPASILDAPEDKKRILLNKEPAYKRKRRISVLNCSDVSCPDDFAKSSTACWVKMTEVSIEGLRDAFRDSESRVRLASDPTPEDHSELVAISWEGGFLDGLRLHLSDNLNTLIGGRGTGKSTIVESIRFVLGLSPLGEEACAQYESCVKKVIGVGTTITLLVRTPTPSPGEYLIRRTVHGSPEVYNDQGERLHLEPADLLPGTDLYGQHEISEVARNRSRLTELLERYMPTDDADDDETEEMQTELRRTRESVLTLLGDIDQLEDQLEALPRLEEQLRKYKELGLDKKLSDHTNLDTEKGLLEFADEQVEVVQTDLDAWDADFPLDTDSLADDDASQLPAKAQLADAKAALDRLSKAVATSLKTIDEAVQTAGEELGRVRSKWDIRREKVEAEYAKVLRELKKERIDGDEFRRLSNRVRDLKAKKKELKAKQKAINDAYAVREQAVSNWENHKAKNFRRLAKTAKKVSRKLKGIVKVEVTADGDRTGLEEHIRTLGGRKQELINSLNEADGLQLQELAKTIRKGTSDLERRYGFPTRQAEHLAMATDDFVLNLEELTLTPTTEVYLNTADSGAPEAWKSLDDLSTGQKATAVLMMLLLDAEGPLIIDQPEDDLDNRFIAREIIQRIRQEKRKRQSIFSTHNANIPVLGDAELILGLDAAGDAEGQGQATVRPEHRGSIDAPAIKTLVKDVLEGGDKAFLLRKERYGLSS